MGIATNIPELMPLRDLKGIADSLNVPVLAVGANARLLIFDSRFGITSHRISTDWDLGVRVGSWEQFHHLKGRAIESNLFASTTYEFKLRHNVTGMDVDLIPFGDIEVGGEITWPASGTEMNVLGFQDAFEHAKELEIGQGVRIKIPTLQLLVAIKLFAYADRRDTTNKDLLDIFHIIKNYPMSGREGELFEEPLLGAMGEDYDDLAAQALLLGLDVGSACKTPTLHQLIPIVQFLTNPYGVAIDELIVRTYDEDSERLQRDRISTSFKRLLQGLEIGIKSKK